MEPQEPTPRGKPAASTTPLEEDEIKPGEERLSPALISRLRAYGRGEDADEVDADPGVETEDAKPARATTTTHTRPETVSQTIEAPAEVRLPAPDDEQRDDRPWIVLVWNDPINLMSLRGVRLSEAVRLLGGGGDTADAAGP